MSDTYKILKKHYTNNQNIPRLIPQSKIWKGQNARKPYPTSEIEQFPIDPRLKKSSRESEHTEVKASQSRQFNYVKSPFLSTSIPIDPRLKKHNPENKQTEVQASQSIQYKFVKSPFLSTSFPIDPRLKKNSPENEQAESITKHTVQVC